MTDKQRIDELEYIIAGVMYFVDKWLDDEEFERGEVNRAATAREKALRIIEEKDRKIRELEKQLAWAKSLADERAEGFNKQFENSYYR